ncbi:MAG: YkgJ family cysteine cluster protein [Lachnospiraceae bacterium]|nr:YkgJ family cysteine cluster protein [Lachnospiraceae bacterium]
MKRQVSLEEISDGRLYGRHDMVRAGCGDCKGCSACCHGMGESAILDPLDVYRLTQGTGLSADALMAGKLELHVVDGIILPNLAMTGEEEACGFLNEDGRCGIHPFRPGVCRLFPLGRYYVKADEETVQADPAAGKTGHGSDMRRAESAGSFQYFLQTGECPAPNKTKVRVEKWLNQPQLARYEEYILKWHNFLARAEALVAEEKDENVVKNINLYLLKLFFMKAYEPGEDFYEQFETRLAVAEELLWQ